VKSSGSLGIISRNNFCTVHWAFEMNDVKAVETVLNTAHNLKLNLTNEKGNSYLILAAFHSMQKIIEILVKRGADPYQVNNEVISSHVH
jgi:ankyrin repeat protein